jgi:hypothetical protein
MYGLGKCFKMEPVDSQFHTSVNKLEFLLHLRTSWTYMLS